MILDANEQFDAFKKANRYQILNKSEKVSEEIILDSVSKAFSKGEDISWNGLQFKLFPSKFVVDQDDFWKLQFLLGSEHLTKLVSESKEVSEAKILDFFSKSEYKFYIDDHKKLLSSSNNNLIQSYVGKLTELTMIDALKTVGIDKMEEAKEKGYTEI
jgi:hypothetical protein